MDNNIENTDRFFRERMLVFEEIPDDQVWDKIASRLEDKKRRKLIYLSLRIAAGMTLLACLGLGYHFVNQSVNPKSVAVISKTDISEKAGIAPSDRSSLNSPVKSGMQKNNALPLNNQPYPAINPTGVTSFTDLNKDLHIVSISTGLTPLTMHEASLLPVPLPHRLGYHRLSAEEILEQTAALTADINNVAEPPEENKDSRWMLGSEVAPLYSYRKIESDYLDKSAVNKLNNSEQGLIAFAGGLRVGYNAGRRLSVQSGLYYSRYGQEKNNGDAIAMDQIAYVDKANMTYLSIPNSTGTIQANDNKTNRYENVIATANGNKIELTDVNGYAIPSLGSTQITEGDITAVQYFDYLELPVTVKYKIIDRKLSFSFLGGLITNFLVNNGVQLKQNGNSESFGTTKDINKVNYQGSVGLGFDYPLMDRMSVSLEPRFRYYLNPIDQRFNVHPYSFGLFAGFSYTLK
jgi:hypothetical protein